MTVTVITESVIFQPVDQIQTSKSSWVFTTAVDFTPYLETISNVINYGINVRQALMDFTTTFNREDPRYKKLLNMTFDDLNLALNEILLIQTEASNLIGHIHNRNKRSLLPLGGLLNFLFGTGDQADIDAIKADIKQLYQNQMDQTNVLNDIITITNVSRGLINENINKINKIIDTITGLNQTIGYLTEQIKPLYIARRFMLMHNEFMIHHSRIRTMIRQMTTDIDLIRQYLASFTSGKLTPQMIYPTHLRQELLKINRQLLPKITLPEDPTINIWHYYRYLTVTPMIDENQLILMIKIPLLDTDSTMTLYKTYNLPIFHPDIAKSLAYELEGSNLAITQDRNYVTILTESEFIKCTLAQGHFCSLNTALYHIDYSKWCLAAMFLKDNDRINKYCTLTMTNITGPQAMYLDQGSWAISVEKPTQMEIRCPQVTQVKSLKPPITFITLQPACSGFSPEVKLPPYFRQYLKGFSVAFKSAHLNIPKYEPTNFRIWNDLNLSIIIPIDADKLKKLTPASTIPVDQLRAKIASFRHIQVDKNKSWIYIVEGGSGSGLILLLIICVCLYWRCKKSQYCCARSPSHASYTDPENQNMMHTRGGAIRSSMGSDLGHKTVRFQKPVGDMSKVLDARLQHVFTEAVLDQLAANGADVNRHHTKLKNEQYVALPAIEN